MKLKKDLKEIISLIQDEIGRPLTIKEKLEVLKRDKKMNIFIRRIK